MRFRAGVASDRGLIRPANEDSFFLRRGLYAVCDGMGGARAGEVASQMACLGLIALDPGSAGKKELRTAIANTNEAIISRSLAEEHLLGMGTTLTAVLVREGTLILAHVGDSRAYLFRDGSLIQLTDDHSWVGEMVRRGELTPAQAAVHPHRSIITRALGTDGDLEPDLTEADVRGGDRVLLCSDGLSGFVSETDMAEILRRDEAPQVIAELLVRAALDGGGEDNVPVVVIDILPESEQGGSGSDIGDQVGDRILIGPSDRGAIASSSASRGKKAGATVRERLSRRATPSVRPVSTRPVEPAQGAEAPPPREEAAAVTPAPGGGSSLAEGARTTEKAPADRAAPASDTEPAAETAPAGDAQTRKRRRRWIFLTIAIVVIVAIAIAAFAVYNSTVYYVGAYDGTVALYRGLPGSFLSIDLSSVVQLGTVEYLSLAPYLRERVDIHDLVSKEEGRAFLETLDEQQ
jgi:PPM family protein phosphatase